MLTVVRNTLFRASERRGVWLDIWIRALIKFAKERGYACEDRLPQVMFEGHEPYLVALSVAIAILGGYTGFGLAARIRGTPTVSHRLLLAGAAAFLAVGIWTMHFVGMLAAPLPSDAAYLVLPTVTSFLICALVVGVSLFFVSIGEPSRRRVFSSAILLGVGIASMHYVGMHGLAGNFEMRHESMFVILSVLIAIAAAYGGLRTFLARQGGLHLTLSAIAFGIAVSGMHYTAMAGLRFVTPSTTPHHAVAGMVASPQTLSVIVALLCFVIAAGFLLSLVPDQRRKAEHASDIHALAVDGVHGAGGWEAEEGQAAPPRVVPAPLGGLGQPRNAPVPRLPIQGSDGTHFIDISEVRSIRADAHYTQVHDGVRERMCSWSISEAEAQLDPAFFVRVHRSYIAAIQYVTFVRKEGDGALLELDGQSPHRVPVSRAKIAEVKARLGVGRRGVHVSRSGK